MTTADGSVLGSTQIFGRRPETGRSTSCCWPRGSPPRSRMPSTMPAAAFVDALRATPPYDELSPAINVLRVNVASTDAGADDPASAGGTGATARTYFDAAFGGNSIRRLLVCNATTALQVARRRCPSSPWCLVVVNSTIYGGSGGSVGTYSLAGGATEIAIHEMGHTAFGLADEYPTTPAENETGHDHHPAGEPTEPNVTTNTNRNTLKWGWAVAAATAIPTMSNPNCAQVDSRASPVPTGTVGLFEGAHYYHCGGFRPEYDCKMRKLSVPVLPCLPPGDLEPDRPARHPAGRAATPISVIARYPEHLDVFAVAADGRTMSDWWIRAAAGQAGSSSPAASPRPEGTVRR